MEIRVTVDGASYRLYYIGAKPVLSITVEGGEEEQHTVDRAWARAIFDDLVALEISPVPSSSALGVGGSSVEISIQRGLNESTFRWWMSVPERWEHLDGIVHRIQGEAMRCHPHYPTGGE